VLRRRGRNARFAARPHLRRQECEAMAKRSWNIGLFGEALALVVAVFDRRTPWYAKALTVFVLAYLISPIDLIPDFIPVAGWLDDATIVPLGLWLASRLVPPNVMDNARARFARKKTGIPAK
jgi:uncharacterized membrane protein YkvA (DUF1232 family)